MLVLERALRQSSFDPNSPGTKFRVGDRVRLRIDGPHGPVRTVAYVLVTACDEAYRLDQPFGRPGDPGADLWAGAEQLERAE